MKKTLTTPRELLDPTDRESCAYGKCLKPLPRAYVHLGLRYCDTWCQEAEWAWQAAKEARR